MIGDNVFEVLDIRRYCGLQSLCAFGKLKPLLETPQIVVDLLPISLRAQWTRQACAVTENGYGFLFEINFTCRFIRI